MKTSFSLLIKQLIPLVLLCLMAWNYFLLPLTLTWPNGGISIAVITHVLFCFVAIYMAGGSTRYKWPWAIVQTIIVPPAVVFVVLLALAFVLNFFSKAGIDVNQSGKSFEFFGGLVIYLLYAVSFGFILYLNKDKLFLFVAALTGIIFGLSAYFFIGRNLTVMFFLLQGVSLAIGLYGSKWHDKDPEGGLYGVIVKMNESRRAITLHPIVLALFIFIGSFFAVAAYRKYANWRSNVIEERTMPYLKWVCPDCSSLEEMQISEYNDDTLSVVENEIEEDSTRITINWVGPPDDDEMTQAFYKLTKSGFDSIYRKYPQLSFSGLNDWSQVMEECSDWSDPRTCRRNFVEWSHDITIDKMDSKGFHFVINTFRETSPCFVEGRATFVSHDRAVFEDLDSEFTDDGEPCRITFDFYYNGLHLVDENCHMSYCGAKADLGEVYLYEEPYEFSED